MVKRKTITQGSAQVEYVLAEDHDEIVGIGKDLARILSNPAVLKAISEMGNIKWKADKALAAWNARVKK